MQEFLRDLLEAAGFDCELLAAVEGRPNLTARMRASSDGPTLCLLGHVDTVLADPAQWTVDPWGAELRDGCVWGRGAIDMKSQVAAEAAAAIALAEEGWRPEAGELLLVFTCDEETGAVEGAQWLCREHPDKVRADVVVNEGAGQVLRYGGRRVYGVFLAKRAFPLHRVPPRAAPYTLPCRAIATRADADVPSYALGERHLPPSHPRKPASAGGVGAGRPDPERPWHT